MMIDEDDARDLLRRAIERAGSQTKLAKIIGCTVSEISDMIRSDRRVYGKVARYLGLKPVYAYLLIDTTKSTKQEDYENKRIKWLKDNGIDPHGGARSTGAMRKG